MSDVSTSARYRFGGSSRTGVLLGLGMRQSIPLVAGCVWLTVWLMAQAPVVGLAGPLVGVVLSFGRWRGKSVWRRRSLIAAGPGFDDDLPAALAGLKLCEVEASWATVTGACEASSSS